MALCPSCGCQISGASRFCPMCGVTLKEDAVNARFGTPAEAKEICMPQANESLLGRYEGFNRCGVGVIRLMRVLAALVLTIIILGAIAGGIVLLVNHRILPGILAMVLGPIGGLLLYLILNIGIVQYENISFVARNTETQNLIGTAQLELIYGIAKTQNESLELARHTADLLRTMDEDLFDVSKQAERQTELLEKLAESQKLNERRLEDIKHMSEQLSRTSSAHVQSARSWHSDTLQLARSIALSVSQLPEKLRRLMAGEEPENAEFNDAQTDNESIAAEEPSVCGGEEQPAGESEPSQNGGQDND